jgi:hypothetical protein
VSGTQLTVQLTSSRPTIVITVKLSDGNVCIFNGTYTIINASIQKQYLVANGSKMELTFDQLSDVPSTTDASITFMPTENSVITSQGYAIYGSGAIVGYINTPGGKTVSFTPAQAGIWDLTGLEIRIGTDAFPINPYVETLAEIIVQPTPILTQIGASLNFDLNNFIVSGVGQVVFTNWKFSIDGGLTFSSVLPSWLIPSSGILKSTPFGSSGSYTISCTAQSMKSVGLSSPLVFDLVVSDPADTNETNIVLVTNLGTTLALSSPVVSIDGVVVSTSTYMAKNIKLVFSTVINSTQQIITLSTSITLSSPVVLEIITKDSKMNLITITQVPSEQNLNIVAFGYTGNLFKKTSGSTVISFMASGSSVPTNQLISTFQPNMQQTIGTANVIINTNGTFEISSAQSLKLTVSYTLNNSTAPVQMITINVGLSTHQPKTIVQSPPPVISLGSNVVRVLVAGSELLEGGLLDLGYASFKLDTNSLEILNITSDFQPTLVQAENVLSSVINIDSMLVDITRDITTQPVYAVPTNSTMQYAFSFEPTRITYNTMTVNAANRDIKLFTESGDQFAEVLLSGSALTIKSTSVVAFSKPIGFMDKNGAYTYIIVQTIPYSSITEEILAVGAVVKSPSGIPFQTAGTLDGKNVAFPGQTLANVVRISSITDEGNALDILAASLTESFSFYTTLLDGSVRYYVLRFVKQSITVSDLTQIPIRSFIGGAQGTVTFLQSGVSTSGNLVKNPSSLRILTLTSPFYGQFSIDLMK